MKRSLISFCAAAVSLFIISSCMVSKQVPVSELGGRWNIVEVNGEKVQRDNLPYIEFDTATKRLHGNAGCNHFNASYQFENSKSSAIKVLPGVSTLMACPDMELEDKVLSALNTVSSVKKAKAGEGMQLLDQKGKVVFMLEKAKFTVSQLNGEWDLIELDGSPVNTGEYKQFIEFNMIQKTFSGNAACNRMSGSLQYEQNSTDQIKFGKVMSTRMACPELEAEQKFLLALEKVTRFEAVDSATAQQVAFFAEDGSKLMVIQKR